MIPVLSCHDQKRKCLNSRGIIKGTTKKTYLCQQAFSVIVLDRNHVTDLSPHRDSDKQTTQSVTAIRFVWH